MASWCWNDVNVNIEWNRVCIGMGLWANGTSRTCEGFDLELDVVLMRESSRDIVWMFDKIKKSVTYSLL